MLVTSSDGWTFPEKDSGQHEVASIVTARNGPQAQEGRAEAARCDSSTSGVGSEAIGPYCKIESCKEAPEQTRKA